MARADATCCALQLRLTRRTTLTPALILCPTTRPLPADGNTYDRATITAWFKTGNVTSPLTGSKREHTHLIPNVLMKKVSLSGREQEGAALLSEKMRSGRE